MRNAAPAHRLQIGDKTARRRQVRPAEAPEAVERRNAEKLLQPRFGPDAVEIASTPAGGIHRRAVLILRRHKLGRADAGKLGLPGGFGNARHADMAGRNASPGKGGSGTSGDSVWPSR